MSNPKNPKFDTLQGIFFFGFGLITIIIAIVNKEWNWTGLWRSTFGASFLLLGIDYYNRGRNNASNSKAL